MQLSPFEQPIDEYHWVHGAPLYGRPGNRDHHECCTFEVFPVHPDEDTSDYQRVPRNEEDIDYRSLGFNISEANSGSDFILVINAANRPKLQWYSRSQFEDRFLYDPLDPPRPRDVDPKKWRERAENRVKEKTEATVHFNDDRTKLFQRIAKLWNGEVVCGVHLLGDECPHIKQLTADLDEDTLNRLYYNTDLGRDIILAFSDADWFETAKGFLKPANIFRKQVWYDLNQTSRLMMNNRNEYPSLNGDPYEGLVHRVTVGLVRLHDELRGWNSTSYERWGSYVIDVWGRDQHDQRYAREILTEHHNWKLYRKTYQKMKVLNQRGVKPVAVFDSRETAYAVFNHWHRAGLGELPNGPFNSDFSINEGQKQIQEAYHNETYEWVVADWTTTWKLKQKTLGPNGPEPSREQILSIDW